MLIYENKNLIPSNVYNLRELQRIQMSGWCLRRIIDEDGNELGGPLRVWKDQEDYPGLAMSRSLVGIEAKKNVG